MKVILAEDSLTARLMLRAGIEAVGHQVFLAENGREAVDLLGTHGADLILLDVVMPVMDGIEAARLIRAYCDRLGIWVPIVFLTAMGKDADVVSGIEAGGDDYLVKPVSEAVLNAKLKAMQRIAEMRRELAAANAKLRQLSEVDGLTGIANRRRFDFVYAREFRRSFRERQPLSLIMADIDHFKAFNDHYGHPAGDACIRQVAEALGGSAQRPSDLAARYGGEEFTILLPNTPEEGALHVAESARRAVEALGLPHAYSTAAKIATLSLGVACLEGEPTSTRSPAELIEMADRALYLAKSKGRNRVEVAAQ
jgi:diguanylate cyclase (GGDEF)-like protein